MLVCKYHFQAFQNTGLVLHLFSSWNMQCKQEIDDKKGISTVKPVAISGLKCYEQLKIILKKKRSIQIKRLVQSGYRYITKAFA